MATVGQPPANSWIILEQDGEDRFRLSWRRPRSSAGRWRVAGFLAVWLCGWAVGEVAASCTLVDLLGGGGGLGGAEWAIWIVVLVVWLGFWTVGGVAVAFSLFNVLRRPTPESLTLSLDGLRYDPGTSLDPADNPQRTLLQRRQPVDLSRAELGPVRLERVGARQRLSVDWGAERLEIGRWLSEPEREWLARVLREWAGQSEPGPG